MKIMDNEILKPLMLWNRLPKEQPGEQKFSMVRRTAGVDRLLAPGSLDTESIKLALEIQICTIW